MNFYRPTTTFDAIQPLCGCPTGIEQQRQCLSFYLRVSFIFSRYSSSHPCVLIARIPETTFVIKEIRWSDSAAVRRRSAALKEDIKA